MIKWLFILLGLKSNALEPWALSQISQSSFFIFFIKFSSSSDSLVHISLLFFFISIVMTEGEKSNAISDADKGKAAAEEKGKGSSHRTRVCMDFNPKTTKFHSQEEID